MKKTRTSILFKPSHLKKIDAITLRLFLGKMNFEEKPYFILKENPGVYEVPIDKIIGKVTGINYDDEKFTAEIEVYDTEYANFCSKLIEEKEVCLSWHIIANIEHKDDGLSKFCFFYRYKDYYIREINQVFYFFLENNKKNLIF